MTKRDFFRILIKLFGLYSLILSVFTYLPSQVGYLSQGIGPTTLILILGVLGLIVLVYILLIRQTDRVIDFLKIDQGFDDARIEIGNFDGQKIIQLALIVIGGFLIIDYLPSLLKYTYLAFDTAASPIEPDVIDHSRFGQAVDYYNWAISAINVIMGYLLLSNHLRISTWVGGDKGK